MSDQSLDREQILALIAEAADELGPEGPRHDILVVGGSLLALHGLRGTTHDVDSARHLHEELKAAVAAVATRHGLAPRWLNDSSAAWRPETLDEQRCEVVFERGRLRALAASFADVFLMKLNALRARDLEDLVTLWPLTGFASPADAVNAYYRAYPLETRDPYLIHEVEHIAAEAATRQP